MAETGKDELKLAKILLGIAFDTLVHELNRSALGWGNQVASHIQTRWMGMKAEARYENDIVWIYPKGDGLGRQIANARKGVYTRL